MDSAGHGIFEPNTKLFPEVTVTGHLPTHPSSFNHENFDPVGVLCVVSLLCANLYAQDFWPCFQRAERSPNNSLEFKTHHEKMNINAKVQKNTTVNQPLSDSLRFVLTA